MEHYLDRWKREKELDKQQIDAWQQQLKQSEAREKADAIVRRLEVEGAATDTVLRELADRYITRSAYKQPTPPENSFRETAGDDDTDTFGSSV